MIPQQSFEYIIDYVEWESQILKAIALDNQLLATVFNINYENSKDVI